MYGLTRIMCLIMSVFIFLTTSISDMIVWKNRDVPTTLAVQEVREREMKEGDIFVSPNGNDENDGSKKFPVKTPQRAVELARNIAGEEKVIYFANGEYNISSLILTEEDSAITFFGEDDVIFNGGSSLKMTDFKEYKDNIKVVDLAPYGITKDRIGKVCAFGQFNTAEKYDESGNLYCELFCDNERMTLSRYPNEGEYLKTGKIIDNGDSKEIYTSKGTEQVPGWEELKNPRGGTFEVDKSVADRVKSWKNSDDIWMFGYFQYDWADSTTPLKAVGDNTLTTKYASVYGFKEGAPFYFFNVFEELDAEGEWYIDRENLKLYFIPPADFNGEEVTLSLEYDNLITINGANNVTFDGITFTGTRASAIKGEGSDITVKNCKAENVGENAVELEGDRILIENNEISGTGKAGIKLTGGDRQTLRSSENKVINNLIHDWSQVYKTYQAAVDLKGVGAVCSHNEIYNSTHEAITYSGNNHIIEYNVIHDVCLESSDAGAIYSGRSWSYYGNEIRYNCIYNLGSGDFKPNGIYFDDALSGQKAYGNLLLNIPGNGILVGGGRDITVENNMIVNAATPIYYDDRAIESIKNKKGGWFGHSKVPGEGLWKTLKEVDVNSPEWKEAFPELSELSDDFNNLDDPMFAANPAFSSVRYNVIVNPMKKLGYTARTVRLYGDVSENLFYTFAEKPFKDDGVYVLKETQENFTPLPLEEMGRIYKLK